MSKKIIEFKEKDALVIKLLVSHCVKGVTNNGSPYLSMTLQDNSGTIEAKYWDVKNDQADLVEQGKVLEFTLEVIKYRQSLQAKVQKVAACDMDSIDISEFVKSSSISKADLQSSIKEYINKVKNPILQKLIVEVMKEYHEQFFEHPAASKNHHNFVGGLATHVLEMLKIAESMLNLYPFLSSDLLYTGIILHDVGKIEELSGSFMTEYTVNGKLLGHISIMQAKVYEISSRLGFQDTEEITLLRHMILSHHGQYEYGSPVLPMTAEAEMLQFIDNIDARMETIKKAFEQTEVNSFTPRIFALENRSFYRHDK